MVINKNKKLTINTELDFYDFMKSVFDTFVCEIDDILITQEEQNFKITNSVIIIEKLWIKLNNISVENYENFINTLTYIDNYTNISINIIDITLRIN